MNKKVILVIGTLLCGMLALGVFWYIKTTVKLVTKEERRALVTKEVSTALERYYDEHGRYPIVDSNEALTRELSAKKYFDNDVRIDVVRYVPINNGQTYELH